VKPFLPIVLVLSAAATTWIVVTTEGPHRENPDVSTTPRRLASELGPGEVVRVLDVEGMCCLSCTGKLHAALLVVPGVREAAVDFEAATAMVRAQESVGAAVLEQALGFEKYSAKARP
jgi:copper chaperone CopZ